MSRYVLFSLIFSLNSLELYTKSAFQRACVRVMRTRVCFVKSRVKSRVMRVLCKERILFKNSFLQFSFHFFLSLFLSLSLSLSFSLSLSLSLSPPPRAKRREEEEGNEREQSACASKGAAKSLSFSSEISFSFFPNTKQQQNASL